jgi:proliferating cell nuclear antigen
MHMLLEVRTVQATAFKILVEALKELLTDTCLEFDATGIKIVAMDTSHVVLVHLRLNADKFETYQCEHRIVIGINMLHLHKLTKTINSNDTLTLFMYDTDVNHLGIRIENTEKNTRTTYMLNLLDLDNQRITIEPTEFSSVITLPSTDFQKLCRDMFNLSDVLEIKNVDRKLIFSCKGDFCSQETVLAAETGCGGPEVGGNGVTDKDLVIQGMFNLKFLVTFTKCTNLCNIVEIYLKNDYPLIIKYSVSSLGDIKLCLAPQTGTEILGGGADTGGNWA